MATKIYPNFYGEVTNGIIAWEKPVQRDYYLKSIGTRKIVEILKPPRKPRSNNQNAYYWGVILELISQETGMTMDESHSAMKLLFLKKRISEELYTIRSTATLNTLEFEEYLEKVKRFASLELNIIIPDPNA